MIDPITEPLITNRTNKTNNSRTETEIKVGSKWTGKRLELSDDYYCYAYLAHIKKNRYEYELKCDETAGFFKTCSLIFAVQMILIILIASSIIKEFAD